jgi:hypothetical protein
MRRSATSQTVTVRHSMASDMPALERLAALDSTRHHDGPVLIAEVDGQLVAALPLDGCPAFSDPFRPTADLVALLELRLDQLIDTDGYGA